MFLDSAHLLGDCFFVIGSAAMIAGSGYIGTYLFVCGCVSMFIGDSTSIIFGDAGVTREGSIARLMGNATHAWAKCNYAIGAIWFTIGCVLVNEFSTEPKDLRLSVLCYNFGSLHFLIGSVNIFVNGFTYRTDPFGNVEVVNIFWEDWKNTIAIFNAILGGFFFLIGSIFYAFPDFEWGYLWGNRFYLIGSFVYCICDGIWFMEGFASKVRSEGVLEEERGTDAAFSLTDNDFYYGGLK